MIEHRLVGTGKADRLLLLGALARADAERTHLLLDLTPLGEGNASKRRLAGWWVASLSNLLIGRYANLPIRIRLPESHSIEVQLLRGGFYFALAQRTGPVSYRASAGASMALLQKSAGTWTPRKGPVLFPVASAEKMDERSYLYANTHVRAEPGYFRRYESSAAFPWLGEVIPRPLDPLGDSVREGFISATCDTFAEVMDNISTHAFNLRDSTFSAGWLGPAIVEQRRSCLMVSATTGGTGSHDRLHFLALDNGFSIPRTLRWQHPESLRHDDAGELMGRVMQRRLTDRGINGHNGAGLWFLYGLARFAGGTITLITEDDRSDGRVAARVSVEVPAVDSPEESVWSYGTVDAPVRGTIVHLQIKVPSLTGVDRELLVERFEEFRRFRSAWPAMA